MDALQAPSEKFAFLERRSTRLWIIVGLSLFVLGLSIQYGIKATEGDGGRSAFLRWRPQLLDFQKGINVYEKHLYPNPPIMAMLLLPITQISDWLGLPSVVGALVWFYLKVGLALLMFRWVFEMVEDSAHPFPAWAKVLTVALSIRPIMGDLSHGNVNVFIAFLVIAGVYSLYHQRQLLSGLIIALAIACKVTPALFIPYLVWKRAWPALFGIALGLALFFWPGFIPASYLGWEKNLEFVQSWIDKMVKPFVIDGFVTPEHNNQSLPGFIYRTFTHSPSFSTYVNQVYTPLEYHNVLSLSPSTAKWIVKGFMGLFALLIVWTARPTMKQESQSNGQRSAEYSLILLGMLLFSERTWKHHCVTLLLPFAVLCYFLAREWAHRGWRAFYVAGLVVTMGLITTTSTSFLGKTYGKLAQVYGAYTFAFVVLIAALTVVIRRSSLSQSTMKEIDNEEGSSLCSESSVRRAG